MCKFGLIARRRSNRMIITSITPGFISSLKQFYFSFVLMFHSSSPQPWELTHKQSKGNGKKVLKRWLPGEQWQMEEALILYNHIKVGIFKIQSLHMDQETQNRAAKTAAQIEAVAVDKVHQCSEEQNTATMEKTQQIMREDDEELPEHFYDSDIASVNEKDFMSDNEPPKDIVYQRKLLHKQKMLHIYKSIIRVGKTIDKPAAYDEITLRFREQVIDDPHEEIVANKAEYLQNVEFQTYNIGMKHPEIEMLVTSMKQNEIAMFECEELETSKKSNIKILKRKRVFIIETQNWTTVIDIDGDMRILKYVLQKGQGPFRVQKFDEVSFQASIFANGKQVWRNSSKNVRMEEEQIGLLPNSVWKILASMKNREKCRSIISDSNMLDLESSKYEHLIEQYNTLEKNEQIEEGIVEAQEKEWAINVQVIEILKVDDIYLDGSILKKTITKGVSTAKPDSSSIMYYALKYLDSNRKVLQVDPCFDSDWWEDFGKLDELHCRKNYLDEYKISKFLKASMKRMKPAEIAEIQCRDMGLFQYGIDYDELKQLWPADEIFPPKKIFIVVRVYNFTEGKTCFNMSIEEKIEESKRKKVIAIQLLNEGNIKKAYKRFQNIVSFYSSGDINQEGYDEKISALMNSVLCLMKEGKYSEMIPLSDIILEEPKHGFDHNKMKINGPQGIKVQGNLENHQNIEDDRLAAGLTKNPKTVDKCLYRKALALIKTGESYQALQCLQKVETSSEEVNELKAEAEKQYELYKQKAKRIFKSMFS